MQDDQFFGINFKNLSGQTKHTIEFRLSNGTISATTWIENINLFGGIVKAAGDLSIIQAKSKSELTKKEQHFLECFENIRNKRFGERETLSQLLDIAVSKDNKEIYMQRYDYNRRKLQLYPNIEESLNREIVPESIHIRNEEIGKTVLYGKERINASEFLSCEQRYIKFEAK